MRREWTEVEKDAVRRLYASGGVAAVQAKLPHRSSQQIRSYARSNGIRHQARLITRDMADEVARVYQDGGLAAVRAVFPEVTEAAVRSLAHRRGIKRKREVKVKKKRVYGRPFAQRPTLLKRSFGEMRQSAVLRQWYRPEKTGPLVATIGSGA